jgi:phosphoenolpyruvate synthase/pyruvate phosphate dikinase
MAQEMPALHAQLMELAVRLESHYHEVQDFEFTIERGTLYCLQTRNGKMNARALVRTSIEMLKEGLITREQALLRVDPAIDGYLSAAESLGEPRGDTRVDDNISTVVIMPLDVQER